MKKPRAAPKSPKLFLQDIPSLTGVRALAAIMVFLSHYFQAAQPLGDQAVKLAKELHIGVTLFFVLSGFLITLRYYPRFSFNWSFWKDYFINRAARVYPVYFLLTSVVLWLSGTRDLFEWFINLTLTKGLFHEYRLHGIRPAWSLTVEEMFYFSALILFPLLKKKALLFYLAIIYGAGILFWRMESDLKLFSMFQNFEYFVSFTFFGRGLDFVGGAGLALIVLNRRTTRVSEWGLRTYSGILGIFAVVWGLSQFQTGSYWGNGMESKWGIAFHHLVLPPMILLFFNGLLSERTWVSRLLATPLLQLLGKSSYVFYLIHYGLFANWIETQVGRGSFGRLFVILWIASILLYLLFEKPVHSFIRHGLVKRDGPCYPKKRRTAQ